MDFPEREPERYAEHKSVVDRIVAGEAPGNLIELARDYFGLARGGALGAGRTSRRGHYPFLTRPPRAGNAE